MLVYGLSSTGATVHLHYCCGKLDDVSFSHNAKKGCAADKAVSKKSCCDNKHIELKLKADQEPAAKWLQHHKVFDAPAVQATTYVFLVHQNKPVNEYATGPPLVAPSLPLFIKNRVFRI